MNEPVYLCWSCDAEFTYEEWKADNPNKTGEPRGLCKWCKKLGREFTNTSFERGQWA